MKMPLPLAAHALHVRLRGVEEHVSPTHLDRAALALSHMTEIYYVDGERILRALLQEEVLRGVFEAGARRFRTRAGNVYVGLFVRRRAVAVVAVTLLRAGRLLRKRVPARPPNAPAFSP